ncbi:GEVED domain-containing protein [Aquimarina megaterium]|uniref:GEVED domain-containing protein n=1 Tax=Aquimarina megaterium TaxID=1443666 RepID=UPI0009F40A4B|nr:GEVED domain-containing protein [Aquimarina megaterium]
MKSTNLATLALLLVFSMMTYGQQNENKAFYHGKISSVEYVSPMSSRPHDLLPPDNSFKEAKDKRSLGNMVVSGKDPQTTNDYYVKNRHQKSASMSLAAPSLVFDTYSSNSQPTDPSLAVGPNHVFVVYNTGFMIYDKAGNQLVGQTAPNPAIFPSGGCCDLTVSYDNAADRWVLSFLGSGAQVAISDGPDPVNAGWYIYNISSISDYQKLSIWSDGYYITDNTSSNNKIWALERSKMLTGDSNAQIVGFNLPGIVTSGFYSPQALNVTDANLPAAGGATIVYMQDNAWSGVSTDHIKLWTVNVDWNNSNNSTISNPQQINTTSFIGVFDGGSFSNLAQPGGGDTIDALQATIMNQAQFRKFASHNSAIFNFVVDTDGGSGKLAGVRWYEFRQSGDNQPWSLHQEGTYTAPDGRHAWNASMAMDAQGNIGMGYTSMSGPSTSSTVRVSSYYTGRLSSDPAGVMTGTEQLISNGNGNIPSLRYGDYSKIDVDPSDNSSFWFITEYMKNGRKGVVGKFQIQSGPADTQAPTNPSNLTASNITSSGATLNWTASTDNVGVTQYNISIGGNSVGTSASPTFNVTGLSPLTNYSASVTAQDAAGNISGSATVSFTTLEGSGVTYCDSASTNVNDEYIGKVQVNTIDNSSGAQFYSDFTSVSTTLKEGQSYDITVTPTWTGTTYSEGYAVWIDYNNNGDFTDAGELVWSKAASTDTNNTGSFTVPSGTAQTSVRMRVSMKYNAIPTSCETFTYGEVEDYTINLEQGTTGGVTYCDSASTNVNDEYIGKVQVNTIDNSSGAQFYSDFTSASTTLKEGQSYDITVTPTWTGTTYAEGYAVWIDYNNNGDFTDSGELVWSKAASTDTNNTGSFTVPSGTAQTSVRMRVSMKYNAIPTSCETFTYGEVEDYTISLGNRSNEQNSGNLLRTFTENSLNNIKLHPNPVNAQLNIKILKGRFERITIFSSTGTIVKEINPEIDSLSIDVSKFASGMYFVRFVENGLAVTKRFIKK